MHFLKVYLSIKMRKICNANGWCIMFTMGMPVYVRFKGIKSFKLMGLILYFFVRLSKMLESLYVWKTGNW